MSFTAAAIGIATGIASLLTSIGLTAASDRASQVSQEAQIEADQLNEIVRQAYAEAAQKGQKVLDKLDHRLNRFDFGMWSSNIRDVINQERVKYLKLRNEVNDQLRVAQNKANEAAINSQLPQATLNPAKATDKLKLIKQTHFNSNKENSYVSQQKQILQNIENIEKKV